MSASTPVPQNPTSHIPWHILGAGAIGGLFACHLQQAGQDVRPLTRTPGEPLVLTLEDNDGEQQYRFPADDGRKIRRLLLTTKAQQSLEALATFLERIAPDAIVVVLQNGLGVQEQLANMHPDWQIIAGTTTEGANRPTPGHIRHAGKGSTWLGAWRAQDQTAASAVLTQWQTMALDIQADQEIRRRLWEKLVINCAINPLTALLDVDNGELVKDPRLLTLMRRIVAEICPLMQAEGIQADIGALQAKVEDVAIRTARNVSSMRQDRRAGRPTEIAYINGFVQEKAKARGIKTPFNHWLAERVLCTKGDIGREELMASAPPEG